MFDLIKIRSTHPLTRCSDSGLKKIEKIDNVTLIFMILLQVFFIFIYLVFKWSRNGDHVTAYFNFVFVTM